MRGNILVRQTSMDPTMCCFIVVILGFLMVQYELKKHTADDFMIEKIEYTSYLYLPLDLQEALQDANKIAEKVYQEIDCANKSSSPERIKDRGPILTEFENYIKLKLGIDPDMDDEEIESEKIKILDEAMALFSLKIRLANCDQFSSIILKKLGEEVNWPGYADGMALSYELAKCFCKKINHCVIQLTVAMQGKQGKPSYYSCMIDPWIVMAYSKKEEKKSVTKFIVALDKYILGNNLFKWNVFKHPPKASTNFSDAYKNQLSAEDREQIDNWVEGFYEKNSEIQYSYSKSQHFFANAELVEEDINNSFTLEIEEDENDDVLKLK